jgi:TctA family transporter
MDVFSNLALGAATAFDLSNLAYCFAGAVLGTMIGMLPGLGPAATIAMLMPLTMGMEPTGALIMLAGIYYGAQYGGSTTAILVNMPGEASSAVTAIDGYAMARKGRAGAALAITAIGSFVAGCAATLLVALLATPLSRLAIEFGSAEYFSLILLGLIASIVLAHGSLIKAIAALALGVLFGSVGTDMFSGTPRFAFGVQGLRDGIDLVALSMGLFGVAEIIRNLQSRAAGEQTVARIDRLMPTREELRQAALPIARGSVVGSVLGVLPGGGALLAAFASYAIEKKISDHPERFGKGAIEGVAGPESANNAGAQTSFIPMLSLGLPANAVMALMMGAMIMQGIVPGPKVATDHPQLFWGLVVSMWVGNLMLVVLNLPLVRLWVRLITIPYGILYPAILVFCLIGSYSIARSELDLLLLALFGLGAFLMVRAGYEVVPFLLGFILGPMLEEHFVRAMILSRGDPMVFLTQPISAGFLAISAVLLVTMTLPRFARRREQVFTETEGV